MGRKQPATGGKAVLTLGVAVCISFLLFQEPKKEKSVITEREYVEIGVDKPLVKNVEKKGKPNVDRGCIGDMLGYCLEYTMNDALVQVTVENDLVKAVIFHGNTTTIEEVEKYDLGAYVFSKGMTHDEIVKDTGIKGFTYSDAYVEGVRVKEVLYGVQGNFYKFVFGKQGLIKVEPLRAIKQEG